VLPWGAGVAVPAVVADVDQHLGAQAGELAHLVGKDGLVADEDSVAMPLSVRTRQDEDLALVAAGEGLDPAGELVGEGE
jgi:hypothetical protein